LSPISIEYLNKIKELSSKHHFKLSILPTPTNFNKKYLIDNMDQTEILKNNFESIFENYFKNIIYLDSTYFNDGTHLIKPAIFTEMYKNELMK